MAFPATYNFSYYRSDTFEFVIVPKNADGTPFDLTGYDANFNIALTRGGTQISPAAVATINDNNTVTCTIPSAAGTAMTAPSYVYDVRVFVPPSAGDPSPIPSNANPVYTLLTGSISVQTQVVVGY